MSNRRPVKGYVKKPQKTEGGQGSQQGNSKNFMYAPQLRQPAPAAPPVPAQDSLILQRLEEMTRRIDLMQNSAKLSATTQLIPRVSQQQVQPPQRYQQASTINMSPRHIGAPSPTKLSMSYDDSPNDRYDGMSYQQFQQLEYGRGPQSNNVSYATTKKSITINNDVYVADMSPLY